MGTKNPRLSQVIWGGNALPAPLTNTVSLATTDWWQAARPLRTERSGSREAYGPLWGLSVPKQCDFRVQGGWHHPS